MGFKKICVEEDKPTFVDGDKDPKIVINSLDYDSLAQIIMLLPIPERIDMEKVCTKWKEACQLAWYDIKKYKCESSIGRCYDNRLLTQSYLKEILLRCGNYLNELSLSDVCNSSIMPFVGRHCKNLTSLECQFYIDSFKYDAGRFVKAFTQLDKLKCIKITVDHNNLNEIVNLSAIIDSLPQEINEIHLFSKFVSIRKKKVSMTFKKFNNLKKLTLHGLWSKDILQEIAEITTLVHLNLGKIEYEAYHFSTKVLETIFCTCKNLKHLVIPPGLHDVNKIPLKKWINFQNLQHLGISCNIMLDLASTIVEYCKNLKHLRIHNPDDLMNETALKKLTELEKLESLILLPRIKLNTESIIAISNSCKKLKRLEIPGCVIVPSVNGNLFNFSSVLDELSKLQYLEHLNLRYADDFEDSTITAIANNCKNLKSLDIQGHSNITETALVVLSNLENLQKLDVSYLDKITDSSLIKLKRLKELHCHECKELTDAGIIQVIKNNPDLEIISISCIDNITGDIVIAADQATKNRTNGIILHIMCSPIIAEASKSIITSQWLVFDEV